MNRYVRIFSYVPLMQHALSSLVHWNREPSAGDRAFDAQAQTIFGLVDEIDRLCRGDTTLAQVRSAAEKTDRLLNAQFRREESMLAQLAYPNLSEHVAEHRKILADLRAIRDQLNGGHGTDAASAALTLFNFVLGVTMGHLTVSDGTYSRYVADAMGKDSTGCA